MRIQIAGPSGIGKTTIARWIEEEYKIPFVSGSMSDLLPQTKEEKHQDMLSHNPEELYNQDFQLLSIRNKLYSSKESYVTDRSYLDNAAYFMYKQSDNIPQCEMENFFELCKKCLSEQVDHLIFFDFTPYYVKNWVMEDNNKRILNKYFQAHISSLMNFILDDWRVELEKLNSISNGAFKTSTFLKHGFYIGKLETLYGSTKVTIISEPNLDIRKKIIRQFVVK